MRYVFGAPFGGQKSGERSSRFRFAAPAGDHGPKAEGAPALHEQAAQSAGQGPQPWGAVPHQVGSFSPVVDVKCDFFLPLICRFLLSVLMGIHEF